MFVSKLGFLAGLSLVTVALALGEEKVITFPTTSNQVDTEQIIFDSLPSSQDDSFILASAPHKRSVPLLLDSTDDEAIHVAAQTFAEDVFRVTGLRPLLYNDTLPTDEDRAIVVGSATSRLVSNLQGNMGYVDGLKGKWESFDVRVMEKPVKGVDEGLVVIGSDRVCRPLAAMTGRCDADHMLKARYNLRSLHHVRADGRITIPLLGGRADPSPPHDRFYKIQETLSWRTDCQISRNLHQ